MRGNHSTIVLFIMGAAIILAAILTIAISAFRNRQQEAPTLPVVGEQVVVEGQPIILRRNPALTVVLVPDGGEAPPPQVVETTQPEGGQATDTPVPVPTETATPVVVVVATNTPVPPPAVEPVIFESYVVQTGDTLFRMTALKATSIALMAQHGIAQDSLNPGDTILLPVGNPAYCPGRRPYAVGEGETIYAISQKVNSSTDELQAINQLGADFAIQAGQILCVP